MENRSYVQPAVAVPTDFHSMVALVVNKHDNDNYELDAVHCNHVANKVSDATLDQDPIYFVVQDCRLIPGNSGGGIFITGDFQSLYGLVSSGPDQDVSGDVLDRRIAKYGLSDWTNATNARCFALPGWPQRTSGCH